MSTPARPLRVALDVSATRLGSAGVARTIVQLGDALDARADVDVIRLGLGTPPKSGSAARRALALRLDLEWYPRGVRREAASRGADVLHLPLPRGPLSPGSPPTIITVHDLAVVRYPETLSGWNRHYSQRTLRRVLTAADAIVAVSDDTAADLAAFAPALSDRVHVIPNGVEEFWSVPAGAPDVAAPYVLAVGTPEPRKNLARLVQAMQRRQTAGAPEQLMLVGADGWGADELPTVPWLHRLGRVDDRTLRSLYQHAAAVAVPSLHEGSGLPVLEAFAAGAPVAAAKVGALPETAGDAAILFDPLDVRAIAAAIDEAITDRDRLIPLGHARAQRATWSAAAERYVALYNSLH